MEFSCCGFAIEVDCTRKEPTVNSRVRLNSEIQIFDQRKVSRCCNGESSSERLRGAHGAAAFAQHSDGRLLHQSRVRKALAPHITPPFNCS